MRIQKLLTGVTISEHFDKLNNNFDVIENTINDTADTIQSLQQNITDIDTRVNSEVAKLDTAIDETNAQVQQSAQTIENVAKNVIDINNRITTEVTKIENTINDTTVKNSGSQTIVGDLTVEKNSSASGDLVVQGDLIVRGTTTTENHETINVKESVIVTNSTGESITNLAGVAIRKNASETYGIMYDPISDTVKLGLGDLNLDNEFTYGEGQGVPLALRDLTDSANNHLIMWDSQRNVLVDGQNKLQEVINTNSASRFEIGSAGQTKPSATLQDGGIFLQLIDED